MNRAEAIQQARYALAAYRANSPRHYIDEAMEDLLAALDAEDSRQPVASDYPAPPAAVPADEVFAFANAGEIERAQHYGGSFNAWLSRYPDTSVSLYLAPPAAVPADADKTYVFNCHQCPVSVEGRWQPPDCPECGNPCALDTSAKPTAVPAVDAEALDFARTASRLLYGFMLDVNAVGPQSAGENLARGIKQHVSAREKQTTKGGGVMKDPQAQLDDAIAACDAAYAEYAAADAARAAAYAEYAAAYAASREKQVADFRRIFGEQS